MTQYKIIKYRTSFNTGFYSLVPAYTRGRIVSLDGAYGARDVSRLCELISLTPADERVLVDIPSGYKEIEIVHEVKSWEMFKNEFPEYFI